MNLAGEFHQLSCCAESRSELIPTFNQLGVVSPLRLLVAGLKDWAIETMGDAKYPLELFMRVITVSLKTQKIVESLPALDI